MKSALPLLLAGAIASLSFAGGADEGDRAVHVIDGTRSPDFYIQSAFDAKAQGKVLTELRSALKSAIALDPLDHRFPEPFKIDAKLNIQVKKLVREILEEVLGVSLEGVVILIDIEGLSYRSPGSSLLVKSATRRSDGIDLPIELRFRETTVSAERVYVRFERKPGTRESFLDDFYVILENPSFDAQDLESLTMNLTLAARTAAGGATTLSLSADSFKAFDQLTPERLQNELKLEPGKVTTGEVAFNMGRSQLRFRKDGLQTALNRRKAAIAALVFDPLIDQLRAIPEKLAQSRHRSMTIPSSVKVNLPCLGETAIRLLRYGQVGTDQLVLAFALDHPGYRVGAGKGTHFNAAIGDLRERIARDEISVAIGLRDRLIGWVLQHSLRGCLKDKLPPKLALGPDGVYARMESGDGPDGTIAIQAETEVKRAVGALLGSRQIRFPVKVSPTLEFSSKSGETPKLELDLRKGLEQEEAALRKTLIQGFGPIRSNIDDLRLQKVVVKKVKGELETGLAKAKISLPLTFLNKADISYADIESDRQGHLGLLLRLDSENHPEADSFWRTMAPYLTKLFERKTPGP